MNNNSTNLLRLYLCKVQGLKTDLKVTFLEIFLSITAW
jgi:hypothetical protein